MAKDPVCGVEVDALRARAVAIVDGNVHYFCCAEHKASFLADPARRAAPVVVEKERPARPRKASLPPQPAVREPVAVDDDEDDSDDEDESDPSPAATTAPAGGGVVAAVRADPPSVEISYERHADETDDQEDAPIEAAPPPVRRAPLALIVVITLALIAMGTLLLLIRKP